jgi:hypothetical protein
MELYLPRRDHRSDGHSRRRYFIRGILSPKIKRGRGMRMYVDDNPLSSARSRVNLDMIRRRNANTTMSLVIDSR